MAILTIEGTYSSGQVSLKELPHDIDEAQVLVTFLPAGDQTGPRDTGRSEAMKRLLERMEQGVDLGGGPYYTNREDLYHDRLDKGRG
jgi:hypothetical protein